MKPRTIFWLLEILAVSVLWEYAEAQIIVTTPYEFAVGASGGATFSSVTFNPKVAQSTLQGVTFGVTGRMTMGEYVGLQLELNYAGEGWNEKYDDNPELHYSRRLNYFQMPFYTRVQFGGKSVKGFINAGPQIGYFLGESTSENLNGATPGKVNEQHNMPLENKFEWGLSGGGGIEIRTGIGFFLIEGRYAYYFGDIYSTKVKDYFSKASVQVITTKLTYLIPLK
ncbi:MAG: PorT family protein [Tannerella sp.]|jgi:hypothetical protein|nr:PorT family protein [Tannerella sp.]